MKQHHVLAAVAAALLLPACSYSPETTGPGEIPATTAPGNIPTSSNVGLSATTPIAVADITIPDGIYAIDTNGDVVAHGSGDWTTIYDGPSWDDPDAQSWANTTVRAGDRELVALCCEPVAGITVDATTGESPFYGEIRAHDGDTLVATIDWTHGIRIHRLESDGTFSLHSDLPLVEIAGTSTAPPSVYDLDVRFDVDGGLYILWNDGDHDIISHLSTGTLPASLSELPVLWTAPDDNAGTELASARHDRVTDGLWVRYGTDEQAVLTRVYVEARTAQMPTIIPLPTTWPAYGYGTLVDGGVVVGTDGSDLHLYRIADQAGAISEGPALLRIG